MSETTWDRLGRGNLAHNFAPKCSPPPVEPTQQIYIRAGHIQIEVASVSLGPLTTAAPRPSPQGLKSGSHTNRSPARRRALPSTTIPESRQR
jgi:hypothetical protein